MKFKTGPVKTSAWTVSLAKFRPLVHNTRRDDVIGAVAKHRLSISVKPRNKTARHKFGEEWFGRWVNSSTLKKNDRLPPNASQKKRQQPFRAVTTSPQPVVDCPYA